MKRQLCFVILFFSVLFCREAFAASAGTAPHFRDDTCTQYSQGNCLVRDTWDFTQVGGESYDTTETCVITGKIIKVEFIEDSITVDTTFELIDSATGRDVLQDLFTSAGSGGEASATATANSQHRYPITGVVGASVWLYKQTVYGKITSGSGTETCSVEVVWIPYDMDEHF